MVDALEELSGGWCDGLYFGILYNTVLCYVVNLKDFRIVNILRL